MTNVDKLLAAVSEILFREWDPIGVNRNEDCRSEYDSYAPTICRYLQNGVDEQRLANHLIQLQRVCMGLPNVNENLQFQIAQRLKSLDLDTRIVD